MTSYNQAIRARSSLPTVSMGCTAPFRAHAVELLAHPCAPRRSTGARTPRNCTSARISFIAARDASPTTRGTAHVVAVLRRVAHLAAHPRDAVGVGQIHDQLELVQALEVREGGIVAGFHQRLEAGLHQRREAPAEHRLLAEQVGLGLGREGRLQDARARASQPGGVRPGELGGVAAGVLMNGVQGRHPAPGDELLAHPVPRGLGGDEDHVHVCPGGTISL